MMLLEDFKDRHKGERAWIACNGPNLIDINGYLLKDEVVFGLNRGYLKQDLPITYLVSIVRSIADQFGNELVDVRCRNLFCNHVEGYHVVKMRFGGVGKIFQTDLTKPMYRGNTVTYVALQLAYWMGFHKVYIVGMNHSFDYVNTVEDPDHHRGLINKGDDPNHFDPNYFGDGSKWLPYEPRIVERQMEMASNTFWSTGRELWNASTVTEMPEDIIPRIDFMDVING